MTDPAANARTDARGQPVPGSRVGAIALHPVLLALYPALSLWAANADEVSAGDAWPALWIPTAAALVLWLVLSLALRATNVTSAVHKAALAASVGLTTTLYVGRLLGEAGGTTLVVLGLIAGAGFAWFVARRLQRSTVLGLTASTNVLSLVLVAFTLPSVASDAFGGAGAPARAVTVAIPAIDGSGFGGEGLAELPDIFYIIPDRYPRQDTLTEVFDYDNSAWIQALEARGFQVQDEALANYPSTGMSLSSTWNMAPVSQLIDEVPSNPKDWGPAYQLLRDHGLGRNLTRAGYQYIHMGTWWSPTATAKSADVNLRLDGTSEFMGVFQEQLYGGANADTTGEPDEALKDLKWFERSPLHTLFQFQELKRLAAQQYEPRENPRFVLAHITVPHEPYVFEADGSAVAAGVAKQRTRNDNFIRQVEFVNNQIDEILDLALAGPRQDWPMIVIQSDEGPHPAAKVANPSLDWTVASVDTLREKLRTFSAILMPESSELAVPEDLTGVNTWRLLLNELLGTDLGMLPDTIWAYDTARIYEFVDVTDKVRG